MFVKVHFSCLLLLDFPLLTLLQFLFQLLVFVPLRTKQFLQLILLLGPAGLDPLTVSDSESFLPLSLPFKILTCAFGFGLFC